MKPQIIEVSHPGLHSKIRYDIRHNTTMYEWRVKFKEQLKSITVNNNNVYVYNEKNQKIRVNISYEENSGYIIVSPTKKYEIGKVYTLELTHNVRLKSNKPIGKKINVKFIVPRTVASIGFENIESNSVYQDKYIQIPDNTQNKKKSKAPASIGIGSILLGVLIYFLLFGNGNIKGYIDSNGNKYYYLRNHPQYYNIIEKEIFTTEQRAKDAGYIKAE